MAKLFFTIRLRNRCNREKINIGGKMLRNCFLAGIIIIFLTQCGKKSEIDIYTGVLEGKSIRVSALSPGKIVDFRVERGEEVQTGDTLAIVDSSELIFQKEQFEAGLKELQVQSEIAVTSSQQAILDLNYISEKYQRVKKLTTDQSMPQQALDDLKIQLDRGQAAKKTSEQKIKSLRAMHEQLTARIKSVQKKIEDCYILAPQGGIIANKFFEQGEAIPPMAPVVEIIHIKSLDLKIYIAENLLPKIIFGQTVTVRVDGLEKTLTGTISWISPKAEFTPKTILTPETRSSLVYAVNIVIKNPDGLLKHGMPVEVLLNREIRESHEK